MKTILHASFTPGFSDTAEFSTLQLAHASRSATSHREELNDSLIDLYLETKQENWAGYPSASLSTSCLRMVSDILQALPADIENPNLGADPDGQVTLEWYRNPARLVSVSVDPQGYLHYAALMGSKKAYGTEPYFDEFPQSISELIRLL